MPSTGSCPAPASRFRRAAPLIGLVLLLAALAGYRFSLIHEGHFFWGDEDRYLAAEVMIDELLAGNYRSALAQPYTCEGRPGFVYVSVIPVLMQRVGGNLWGIERDTLQYYDAASAFNTLVTLGISVCIFGVGRIWARSGWYALLITAVYSLLCNANVWIRHLMPCQESLLVFLALLWLLSLETRVRVPHPLQSKGWGVADTRALVAGCLCTMGYAIYPAHYLFVLINLAVLLASAPRRARAFLLFGGSAAAVFALLELVALWGGTSYIGEIVIGTVAHARHIQGWPPESYVFVWRYLRDVEGVIGVLLFILFVGFAVLVLWRRGADVPRSARAAILAAIACYLLHASLGVLSGRTGFYGRILGMYLPFVVSGAVLGIVHLRRVGLRRLAVCGMLAASVWSFATFAQEYARIAYPADLLAGTMAKLGRPVRYAPNALLVRTDEVPDRSVEAVDPELVLVQDITPRGSDTIRADRYGCPTPSIRNRRIEGVGNPADGVHPPLSPKGMGHPHQQARTSAARFIGVNLKHMIYAREQDTRFQPPDAYELIVEALHPNALPATGYEVCKPWERRRFRKRRYTMRIYERNTQRSAATATPATTARP